MSITKRIPIAIGIKPNQQVEFTNKTIDASQNTIRNIPNNALENNTISINGSAIPLGGNINLQVEGGSAIVDTDTTYSIKATSVVGGVNFDLDAGGSGTGTDSIKFEGGGNVTITRVNASTIRISDAGQLGGVALTSDNTATLSNKTISGSNNTFTNIPNSALTNNSITINGSQVQLGGSINIAGGGGSSANTVETLTNKTISGAENTFSNIPNNALLNPLIIINGTSIPLGSSFEVSGLGDVTLSGTQTLTNKSLIQPVLDRIRLLGTVTAGAGSGSVGNVGQVLTSTGTGVQWSTPSNTNATTQFALSFGSGLTALSAFNGSSEVTASIDTNVVATLTGTQTLTNKTLTSPVISSITNSGTLTLPTGTDNLVSRNSTDTLTNKTISNLVLSGSLTAGGAIGTSGQVLTSTGSGVQWASVSGGGGASNLDGLIDVVITTPSNGQVLQFNGSNWVNSSSASTRITPSGTASSLGANTTTNMTFSAAKSYALFKVETSCAAWVRIYSDSASRTADAGRDITTDPSAGVNIIADVITTSASTQIISPGIFGFNNEDPINDFVYIAVTNRESTTQNVQVTLTLLPLE